MIMKKTAKTPDKRIVIADAFQQLMNSNPADKITVKMLIDACGISRPTFYYYFKDIPDVVEYLIMHSLYSAAKTDLACTRLFPD